MFSYKSAVAVKDLGYRNIKIYNGGIKDWKKSGLPLTSINSLPDIEPTFISADRLLKWLTKASTAHCREKDGGAMITILDFRNENFIDAENPPLSIATDCPIQKLILDDLRRPEIREKIPLAAPVVTITETGNRDAFIQQYLSTYGYTNISGLQFGMRGWLKLRYPSRQPPAGD